MEVHNAKDLVVASAKSLRRKAKACEEEAMEKLLDRTRFEHISNLSHLLHNVYSCHRPTLADYGTRRDLIHGFNEIAKEVYGSSIESPVIEPYGSFVMDMFSSQSDLDLSINFKQNSSDLPREEKIKILKKFADKFRFLKRKGHVAGLESVLNAKVPIVKVIDHESKVECDFSVENRDGILKSQIIHILSGMDDRFQKLCVLMKLWAKSWEINCSRNRTQNSISIVSMVAFHLQSLHQIEDFTDQTQNFAGAVGEHGLSQIYGSIQNSISYLSDFFYGKKSGSDLRECLFHGGVSTMPPSTFIRPTVPSHDPAKRSYPEEDYNASRGKRMRHDTRLVVPINQLVIFHRFSPVLVLHFQSRALHLCHHLLCQHFAQTQMKTPTAN